MWGDGEMKCALQGTRWARRDDADLTELLARSLLLFWPPIGCIIPVLPALVHFKGSGIIPVIFRGAVLGVVSFKMGCPISNAYNIHNHQSRQTLGF